MGSCYPVHEPREPCRSRPAKDQVPVIGKDAVGDQWDAVTPEAFSQNLQKLAIILWPQEDRRASDAAIDDMEVVFVLQGSGSSRHNQDLC